MTVRGRSAALPYFLLVDNEFHNLHIQLRNASKNGDQKKWLGLAEKFAHNIEQTLPCHVLGSDLAKMPSKHLPKGSISLGCASVLLDVYRMQSGKWQNFTARRELQKLLVCKRCVQGWVHGFRQNRIDWNRRNEKDGHTYVVGNTGRTSSCNINFNIQGYATHANKEKGVRYDPGYRCTGTEKTPLYPILGVTLSFVKQKISWGKMLFFSAHPAEKEYPQIQKKIVLFQGFSSNEQTSHVNRMAGFIALNTFGGIGIQEIKSDAQYDFSQYQSNEVVILEGIASKRGSDSDSVQYILHRSGSTIRSSFEDLTKPQPLGIFFFVKERHLFQPEELKQKLKIFDPVPLNVSEGLGGHIGWKPTEGQLYRLRDSFYHDLGDGSVEISGQSRIDLNKHKASSPLISRIKERHSNVQLPTLQTALKYIQAFKFSDSQLTSIGDEQRVLVKSGDKILVRAQGFQLKNTRLTLEIFPEEYDKGALAPKIEVKLEKGFASFTVPSGKRSKIYRMNLSARDNTIPEPMVFTLKVSGSPESSHLPEDVKLEVSYDLNKQILETYNKHKLMQKLEIIQSEAEQLLRKGRYMELLKSDISKSSNNLFTVPTSRIQQRYIGLDFLSFERSGSDFELSQRLRSSGLYYPVPPEMDDGNETKYLSTNKWNSFEDHIVRLNPNVHLLFTASPLRSFGISLDDITLKQKGLIVTNHGTFIEGSIPTELRDIEIVERPKFMELYAKTPEQHFDILNKIIETIPIQKRIYYNKSLTEHFVVTHEFRPGSEKWRVWGNNAIPPRSSWSPVSKLNLSEMGITKSPLKAEHQDKNTVFFDVLFIERKSGDERQILVRRHHKDGEVDYLSIARFIKKNADYWGDHQLEWVSDIERHDIPELEHLFLWTGGKYQNRDLKRAYDWHYLQIETLRAFSAISNHSVVSDDSIKWLSPVPLYKYLSGGIKDDSMGGLLNDPILRYNSTLKEAVLNAVRRWTWTQKSGEN